MMKTILLAEDSGFSIRDFKRKLEQCSFEANLIVVRDGQAVIDLLDPDSSAALDSLPDLIVLDVMLPRMNGFEVCEVLRSHEIETPVIFLTAKSLPADKITGLNIGGDDYMTKPFSVGELLARIKTVLRRVYSAGGKKLVLGPLEIDLSGRAVKLHGKELELTTKEFELLCFMARNSGKVMPRESILQKVWGFNYYGTARTIDNFINRLRQKIEADPLKPRFLLTVRGVGYKFSPPSS